MRIVSKNVTDEYFVTIWLHREAYNKHCITQGDGSNPGELQPTCPPPSCGFPSSSPRHSRCQCLGLTSAGWLQPRLFHSTQALRHAVRPLTTYFTHHTVIIWFSIIYCDTFVLLAHHWCLRVLPGSSRWSCWHGFPVCQPSGSGSELSPSWCRCRWRGVWEGRSVSRLHRSARQLLKGVVIRKYVCMWEKEDWRNVCWTVPGLETTMMMQSGLYLTIWGTMCLKMLTFLWTRFSLLSPSCWRTPAVTTTMREFAVTE